MRCPRCGFEGELVDGTCIHCGYRRTSVSHHLRSAGEPDARTPSASLRSQSGVLRSPSVPLRALSGPSRSPSMALRSFSGPSHPFSLSTARSGDLLHQGRYRLVDQLILPDNQQGQGAAWLAIDNAAGQTQVVLREVLVSAEEQANKKQIVRQVALRLSEGTQHSGFPRLLDVFNEGDNYFIVLQHIEGESLASLLRRQGGALPERTVAEYGRQLCEMLTVLSRQQPPLVHGAISPETVIVSPDRDHVHLVHLPLFPPQEPVVAGSAVGYKAPEQARKVTEPAVDLYSVAATMHHAVTGFDPRERIAFFYPPARRLNPLVSQQMEAILAQELRLSAPQRYTRAADMQGDLAALLATKMLDTEKKPALASTDPLTLNMSEMRQRMRRRSRNQVGIFAAICLLVLAIALFVYIYPSLKISVGGQAAATPNATATTNALVSSLNNEWQAEAPLYKTKQIGLSDGRYIFDTYPGRLAAEVNYKKQAALALLNNNVATALNYYNLAVTNDKTDAEARIYYEDLQIATQNDPYVTIVLGLPLDASTLHLSLSRPDLQAAFAFQDQVNTQNPSPLPGGVKLRILIGNSGVDNSDAGTIAQFIAKRVQLGNLDHIVAVAGWPTSGESGNAIPILAGAKIPIVTQTASSTSLDGTSPYFFRVNPNDTIQGKAQGKLAYQVLGARKVLVLRDVNDPYRQSLADAFTSSFQSLGGKVIDDRANDFTEQQTTVEQYRQLAVQDALINHVDLIFMPGFDVDGIRLARALGEEASSIGWSTYLAHLKILGGDGLDTGLILGDGVGSDATLAHTYPSDMQHLIFTSFSDQAEGGAHLQTFLNNWTKLYGVASPSNPTPPVPINSAIMVDDVFGVLIYAMGLVKGPLAGDVLRNALASIGSGGIKSYQGSSGSIAFGSDGNPVNKAVVLLEVAPDNNGQNRIKFLGISS